MTEVQQGWFFWCGYRGSKDQDLTPTLSGFEILNEAILIIENNNYFRTHDILIMKVSEFILKNRNNDFCRSHNFKMNLIFIWIVNQNRDKKKRFRWKFFHAILEKWIFENFRGHVYDGVIYRDGSYLWSNEEQKKLKLKTLCWCLYPSVNVGVKFSRTWVNQVF